MEVQVISNTIQKFNGVSFYKCGEYFQRKGKRLHRLVWEYHNGKIPKGYSVHHIDENKSNNSIENLKLMENSMHNSLHMKEEKNVTRSRESIKVAREYANKWHSSEKGKEMHSRIGKQTWENVKETTRFCAWCGGEYKTRDLSHKKQDTFCCANHKAAALRWRRKHEGQVNYPNRKG